MLTWFHFRALPAKCVPFSCKMYKTLYNDVIPKLSPEQKSNISFVVQQVPQPSTHIRRTSMRRHLL